MSQIKDNKMIIAKTLSRAVGTKILLVMTLFIAFGASSNDQERTSRLSDVSVAELDIENYPKRPEPILEWGNDFLNPGNIGEGIEMPGGAVWQPSLLVFGTFRSALQSFDAHGVETNELASRLDLYANLQLTGTERILLGVRPLDKNGQFTGYEFGSHNDDSWQNELNSDITTLFFEGDFGELLPDWDKGDTKGYDIGFAIGRQPLNYQEGMLINDSIDAIGITRNTLLPNGGSDMQITLIYGWNEIHRNDNHEYNDTNLFGLFVSMDRPKTTLNFDLVYIDDKDGDTDGIFWGISDVRRIGHYNLSSRILGSHALEDQSAVALEKVPAVVSDGYLVFAELSWTPAWTDDNVYVNVFVGIDEFSSASRGPANGGALGRTGILFSAIGLGHYGAPISDMAQNAYGLALGYQQFINPIKNQFIYEVGFRKETESIGNSENSKETSIAAAVRYVHALSQRTVFQFDIFKTFNQEMEDAQGIRAELLVQF
jgi:hypothetical protein